MDVYVQYQVLAPKLLIALGMLLLGLLLSYALYYIVEWLIRVLGIKKLIQKISGWDTRLWKQDIWVIVAKSVAVFVFILIFRKVVQFLGFNEVEIFLTDLIEYLPKLFIGVLIWFFGIRFSNSVYSIVKQSLHFSDENTSNALALMSKIVILFLTFMIALHYIEIVDDFIINAILVWFIAMISLAWGIAFWLGWKGFAEEMLWRLKQGTKNPEAKKDSKK